MIAELPAGFDWPQGWIDPSWPLGLISAVLAALLLWPIGARLGLSPASRATAAACYATASVLLEVYDPAGTDGLGRDVFARVLVATRLSLWYALLSTALASTLGITLGVLPSVMSRRSGLTNSVATPISLMMNPDCTKSHHLIRWSHEVAACESRAPTA